MTSLADDAYEVIKKDIMTCTLTPGQKISQSQLATRYDAGTTPIREALQRLAQEEFVRPVAGYGYIVSPLTLDDVRELFELRSLLEAASCRWAATRGDAADLESIRAGADFIYVKGDEESYRVYLSGNRSFHLSIARASGNHRLVHSISHVFDEMTRIFHVALTHDPGWFDVFVREHVDLANALCDRDPDRAEGLIRAEVDFTRELVVRGLVDRSRAQPSGVDLVTHRVSGAS